MVTKKEEVELIEAEVVDDLYVPDWDFEEHSRKKPRGTRKKDFPAFNKKTREEILKATEVGMPLDLAAANAGISLSTLQRWLERGERGAALLEEDEDAVLVPVDEDFVYFYLDYKKQTAAGVLELSEIVIENCRTNPNLALRFLEKLHPHYSPKQSIEMTGKVAHAHIHGKISEGTDLVKQLTTDEIKFLKADYVKKKQNLIEAGKVEEPDES